MEERATAPAAGTRAGQGGRRLRVTLVRSVIGYRESQRRTVKSLGLRRIHQAVEHYDSPSIQGMLAKVAHLVRVEEIAADLPVVRRETGTQRFQRRMEKKAAEMATLLAEFGLLGDDADLSGGAPAVPATTAPAAAPAAALVTDGTAPADASLTELERRVATAGETADDLPEGGAFVFRPSGGE